MSECSLSGRGRGHVSNFYIVDLENFATHSKSAAVTRAGDDEVGLDGGLEATVSTENDSAAGTCVDDVFAVVHQERNPRETESGTHTATQSSQ